MFTGECLCLILFAIQRYREKKRLQQVSINETNPLLSISKASDELAAEPEGEKKVRAVTCLLLLCSEC